MLGDDIVICNDKVANKYISIMNKLGVEISLSKTHVSKNTYEFAKRWISKKVEITGVPLRGILTNISNPLIVLQQIMIYTKNVGHFYNGTVLELVSELYHNLKIGNRFYSKKSIFKRCYNFYHILRYAYKISNFEELRNYFLKTIKNEHILVPNNTVFPSFMKAVLSLGLSSLAESSGNEINKIFKNYSSSFIKDE
jgi:hypothetical protein